jgi:predicted Zn-dependent peptidase
MKRLFIIALAVLVSITNIAVAKAENGGLKLPPYKKVTLKNGVTVLLMEQHEVPIISFNFIVRAGSVSDPVGKEGLASITAGLLRKGTKTRTADQIASELDFVGGVLSVDANFDYTGGVAEFVKKDINKGLDLLSDVLSNPTFPQEEVAKLIKQRVDSIKADKDSAENVIGTYFSAYMYGNHPYGRAVSGDEKSVASITRNDIASFYREHYGPSNSILAVAGDFNTAEMEQMLTGKFGAWQGNPTSGAKIKEPVPVEGKRLLLVDKPDSTQTFFQIGNLGIERTNPDRVFIQVVNTLFGGRFTSMLNTELRIKSGLTYGARSSFSQRVRPGPFTIYTYTRNETTEQAIDLALDVLKRLHEKGITEQELKSAKEYLKGQFPPTIETTDQLAALIAQLEFYGLDAGDINNYYTKIDSMTLADAGRVIKQYFPADNLVFVLIGKASEIGQLAKKYAPKVDTKPISQPGF